jgi:hypothetical protein
MIKRNGNGTFAPNESTAELDIHAKIGGIFPYVNEVLFWNLIKLIIFAIVIMPWIMYFARPVWTFFLGFYNMVDNCSIKAVPTASRVL